MFKSIHFVKTPSVERLLKLWARLYKIDLYSSYLFEVFSYNSFLEAASAEGRALTVAKFKNDLLLINSQMAWIKTNSLYSEFPNVFDFIEARYITDSAFLLYNQMLSIYQKQSLTIPSYTAKKSQVKDKYENNSLILSQISPIEDLAYVLEPILMEFQNQYFICQDWRAIGFMTTQLKFTNNFILDELTPIEQFLLRPYLKFIEDQIAIPWERVCAAASKYKLGSPRLTLIEQILSASEEISKAVYCQLVEFFPNYYSCSGRLSDPNVAHSIIRDLNMFQAYLCLCILEHSLAPVKEELLPLCEIVMEKLNVKGEILESCIQILVDEIIWRVKPEHYAILLPYVQGLQQAFFK